MSPSPADSPRALLLPYALPYLCYVGLGSVFDVRSEPLQLYGARALVVGAALVWGMRFWLPLRGPKPLGGSLALGGVVGLVGTAVWIALAAPFAPEVAAPWSDSAWLARALVATALPPLIEEPLLRGYVFGLVLLVERARRAGAALGHAFDRDSLASIAPGQWSWLALGVSSAAFASGHAPSEWLAAGVYGLLMCGLWIARGDLVSCVSAHAISNAALAVYVRTTGSWVLW
ncbi:MAG: CPBP family intramembrane metalloprotease [Deltaproteobacteria bacterium]|nr:CPBP family intramembrane metalloprotease [Deltaproteobacteria bacterium]